MNKAAQIKSKCKSYIRTTYVTESWMGKNDFTLNGCSAQYYGDSKTRNNPFSRAMLAIRFFTQFSTLKISEVYSYHQNKLVFCITIFHFVDLLWRNYPPKCDQTSMMGRASNIHWNETTYSAKFRQEKKNWRFGSTVREIISIFGVIPRKKRIVAPESSDNKTTRPIQKLQWNQSSVRIVRRFFVEFQVVDDDNAITSFGLRMHRWHLWRISWLTTISTWPIVWRY